MPVLAPHDPDHRQRIVRRISAVRGSTRLRSVLAARPDYGRVDPTTERSDGGVLIAGDGVRMGLTASVDLDLTDGTVTAELELEQGEEALFVLEVLEEGDG